jgi:putative hydrolase of the HAD superfamily
MRIQNIIFDVGKVLVSYEPELFMDNLGFDAKTKKAVDAAMFSNPIWVEADAGTYPKDAYLEKYIAEAPEYEKDIRLAYERMGETVEVCPYAVEWVSGLKKQGYHLYVLSNYSEHLLELTRDKMLFLPYMDGVVFSSQCKYLKPKPEIYRHLLDTYHLDASESVFIDDRQENVEGAMDCGIPAIRFSDYETTRRLLSEMM